MGSSLGYHPLAKLPIFTGARARGGGIASEKQTCSSMPCVLSVFVMSLRPIHACVHAYAQAHSHTMPALASPCLFPPSLNTVSVPEHDRTVPSLQELLSAAEVCLHALFTVMDVGREGAEHLCTIGCEHVHSSLNMPTYVHLAPYAHARARTYARIHRSTLAHALSFAHSHDSSPPIARTPRRRTTCSTGCRARCLWGTTSARR